MVGRGARPIFCMSAKRLWSIFFFQPSSGSFFSKDIFVADFAKFQRIKAKRVYSQSLYLIKTLVELRGGTALSYLIHNIFSDSNNEEKDYLSAVELNFSQLREQAEQFWLRRNSLAIKVP